MDQRRRSQRRAAMWAAPVALLAATAAACGSSSTNSPSSASPASSPPAAAPNAAGAVATVSTASTPMGTFLTAGDGRTLYLFEKDTRSTCTGACAANWPPLVTSGAPQAAGQAQANMLAISTRPDGTTQVTYAGHPLSMFIGDRAAGSTTGQGLDAFGAEWYVVAPSGQKIESTASSSPSTISTTSGGGVGY